MGFVNLCDRKLPSKKIGFYFQIQKARGRGNEYHQHNQGRKIYIILKHKNCLIFFDQINKTIM